MISSKISHLIPLGDNIANVSTFICYSVAIHNSSFDYLNKQQWNEPTCSLEKILIVLTERIMLRRQLIRLDQLSTRTLVQRCGSILCRKGFTIELSGWGNSVQDSDAKFPKFECNKSWMRYHYMLLIRNSDLRIWRCGQNSHEVWPENICPSAETEDETKAAHQQSKGLPGHGSFFM